MVVVTDVSTASEKVILWVEWRVPFQSSIIGFIILPVTLVGNVKRIPCSDWPPKRTRWAPARDCPLWSRTKRENRIRGADLHSSKVLDNVGDGVAKRSSKKTIKTEMTPVGLLCHRHSWPSLPALEINKPFLVFIRTSFCYTTTPLLTKPVRPRWQLDISLVLLFAFHGSRLSLGP